MRRFFTEPHNINGSTAIISEDAAHITKVLRMNVADEILLFDGTGYEYISRLTSVCKEQCEAEILSSSFSEQEPSVKVTIYQGIPKSGKMEGIIQKSVEAKKNLKKSSAGTRLLLKPQNNAAEVFFHRLNLLLLLIKRLREWQRASLL